MNLSNYILLGQGQALKRRLDIAANNMANTNTVGFRKEEAVFHEYVERGEKPGNDLPAAARTSSFVLDYRAMRDPRQGSFQTTGNPLDLMIEGGGWFAVDAGNGETAYTRAGFLKVSDAGELVISSGQRVLDEGGGPIAVPLEARATLAIAADGTVSAQTGDIGRIAVTSFDDESQLSPRGDGLMTAPAGAASRVLGATETHLRSGGVEGSNVEPIVETTELVDILRSYQASVRMADAINDMRKRAIERLGKLG